MIPWLLRAAGSQAASGNTNSNSNAVSPAPAGNNWSFPPVTINGVSLPGWSLPGLVPAPPVPPLGPVPALAQLPLVSPYLCCHATVQAFLAC